MMSKVERLRAIDEHIAVAREGYQACLDAACATGSESNLIYLDEALTRLQRLERARNLAAEEA